MIHWSKPEPIPNFGLVYVSECKRFMVVKRDTSDYVLSYVDANDKFVRIGSFSRLTQAKEYAEQTLALCG